MKKICHLLDATFQVFVLLFHTAAFLLDQADKIKHAVFAGKLVPKLINDKLSKNNKTIIQQMKADASKTELFYCTGNHFPP